MCNNCIKKSKFSMLLRSQVEMNGICVITIYSNALNLLKKEEVFISSKFEFNDFDADLRTS